MDHVKLAYPDKLVIENVTPVFHPNLQCKEAEQPVPFTRSGRNVHFSDRYKIQNDYPLCSPSNFFGFLV
ncbi:unnamed protein product [Hymenolepis diminuta]|uniref:Uncharacterized protein n=1 Tax=Hymenolepis diminuta TaxID=6216 RepID=A0A564Y064_HYMDI|nr:unnamed protein product [Hymenolepis diminuta]